MRVHLSDGSSFIVHGEVAARESIRADRALSPEEISSLQSKSEAVFARHSALTLLSRAPHTRKGLAAKLALRGFGEEAIKGAIARMIELGYLDDRSFAMGWAEARVSSRAEGWNALYRGLIRKGVPRAIAREVTLEVFSEERELEKALSLVEGLPKRRAASRLTARGFRSRTIAHALQRLDGQDREAEGE